MLITFILLLSKLYNTTGYMYWIPTSSEIGVAYVPDNETDRPTMLKKSATVTVAGGTNWIIHVCRRRTDQFSAWVVC
jgi:hypothetical protein